jgi:hypothetical protein
VSADGLRFGERKRMVQKGREVNYEAVSLYEQKWLPADGECVTGGPANMQAGGPALPTINLDGHAAFRSVSRLGSIFLDC